jgi:hypothetical protein
MKVRTAATRPPARGLSRISPDADSFGVLIVRQNSGASGQTPVQLNLGRKARVASTRISPKRQRRVSTPSPTGVRH